MKPPVERKYSIYSNSYLTAAKKNDPRNRILLLHAQETATSLFGFKECGDLLHNNMS